MKLFLPKSLEQIKKDLKGLEPFEIYQHIPIIIESSINSYNKLKIIKGILDYCDRNYNNEALIAAVVKSENRILRFLINKGVFIKNTFLEHGGTSEVLWNAAYSENVEAINIMLQEGYITVKDIIQLYRDSVSKPLNLTGLIVIDTLKKFLPKEINESKNSAVFVPKSQKQIIYDIKYSRKPLNLTGLISSVTRSSTLASKEKLKIVQTLVALGADIKSSNKCVVDSIRALEPLVLEFLIVVGANVNQTKEPLIWAAYHENFEALDLLIKHKKINLYDINDAITNSRDADITLNLRHFLHMYKHVNESLTSILKPKSEEEIEDVLSEMEGDELYELWFGSLNPEYLKRALKKGYQLSSDELEHAMTMGSDTNIGKETIDLMMPAIMKNFPLGISKTGSDNYTIKADDWGDFVFLFHEDRDVSRDGIQSILDGTLDAQVDVEDVLDFRFTLEKYDADHDTSYVVSQIKEAALLEANEVGLDNDDVQLIHKQSNLYGIISVIRGLKDELKNTHMALRHTLSEVLTVSATDEMFESVLNSIKNYLDAKEVKVDENGISMLVSQGTVTKIFRASIGDSDGELHYTYPYYGFSGDPEKYFDVFVDALENRLSDLK